MSVVSMSTRIDQANMDRVRYSLASVDRMMAGRHHAAMQRIARQIYDTSQYLVPVDTSALKESARWGVSGRGWDSEIYVIYDWPYAIFVHEILWYHHDAPTQALFLHDAIQMVRPTMQKTFRAQSSNMSTFEVVEDTFGTNTVREF